MAMGMESMLKSMGFDTDAVKKSLIDAKDNIESQVKSVHEKLLILDTEMDCVIESLLRIELKLETLSVEQLSKIPRPTDEQIAKVLKENAFGFGEPSVGVNVEPCQETVSDPDLGPYMNCMLGLTPNAPNTLLTEVNKHGNDGGSHD